MDARPARRPRTLTIAARLAVAGAAVLTASRGSAQLIREAPPEPSSASMAPSPATPTRAATPAVRVAPAAPPSAESPAKSGAFESVAASPGRFETEAAGIAFDVPAGLEAVERSPSADEFARYVSPEPGGSGDAKGRATDDDLRVLTARRLIFDRPTPLTTDKVNGVTRVGLLETLAAEVAGDSPRRTVRQEQVNLGGADAGLVAVLHRANAVTALTQMAVVRASDELYYVLTYTTPAPSVVGGAGPDALPEAAAVEADPAVRRDVADFAAVTDSVALQDRSGLRRDQDDRLFRTRALYANLTPQRLERAMVPERWLRLTKGGRDVGYSYIVEEVAGGLPRPGGRDEPAADPRDEGVRVGVRTRTVPESGLRVDTEGWSWSAYDRRRTMWSNVAVVTDARPPEDADGNPVAPAANAPVGDDGRPASRVNYTTEIGTSAWRDKPVAVPLLEGGGGGQMRMTDEHVVTVRRFGRTDTLPTITRDLPPFYLPDAMSQLLPRLVADRAISGTGGSTYLFATYVNEAGEVMSRYVDVKPERDADLGGKTVRAIPVEDRIGLSGGVTTHYVSPADYSYLGSVNPQSGVTALPTDRETLEGLWAGADLTRPAAPEGADAPADRPERGVKGRPSPGR